MFFVISSHTQIDFWENKHSKEVFFTPGLLTIHTDDELKGKEEDMVAELTRRAVSQGVVDSADQVIVRDILPNTDFAGVAAGGGYLYEMWRADMTSLRQDASTASAANTYNEAISTDLDKEKLIGILGVKKKGEDMVAAVKFSLGTGVKIKDIWQIDSIADDSIGLAREPLIYNCTNKIVVDYYLKNRGIVELELIGKTCEAIGDTIIGGTE